MSKIIINKNKDENDFKIWFSQKYIFISNLTKIKRFKKETDLCVIQSEFKQCEIALIKEYKEIYKNTEFWISSSNQSKENILLANKLGIKTVISSPVNQKLVEEFFLKKYNINPIKPQKTDLNYSEVSNLKVMIVDDNPMNVQLLEEILAGTNLKISSFLKPKEAFRIAMNEKFDLFLLDIMMPEMSGFELAKKIKDSSTNKHVPFIFISALADSYNKKRGYDLGSVAYIEKPFDVNVIKSQILNILKNKKTQEEIITNQETFFATIAHDLKTPMNAEINALKLLLNPDFGNLTSEQKEILDELLFSVKFTKNMLDNILYKNKLENNKITLSKQIYSLEDTVKNCIDLAKYILLVKNQKIKFICNTSNTFTCFDYIEIQRAMNNLITNAIEYSHDGNEILIEIFRSDNKLGVSVQDFGRGIPIEDQKDIFAQYVSHAKKYKKVGSGLGLFITKDIIEKHNGEIYLESREGLGTKITFFLPICLKE